MRVAFTNEDGQNAVKVCRGLKATDGKFNVTVGEIIGVVTDIGKLIIEIELVGRFIRVGINYNERPAGMRILISRAMIAMTTSSSINVNP